MKTYIVVLLSLLSLSLRAQDQKLKVSFEGGVNLTFISISESNQMFVNSSYYDNGPSDGSRPGFRGFAGAALKYNFTKASGVKLFTQFEVRGSKNTHTLDEGSKGYTVNNSYVNLGLMYVYSLPKILELGIGINNHFLVGSRSTIKNPVLSFDADSPLKDAYGSYNNYNFRNYLISVPFQIGLKLGKNERVTLIETFDIPLMSRLNNNFSSKYKQYEFTLQSGVNIRIN